MPGHLRFENVTRRFGNFTAVARFSLEIEKGETFSLLGPSGCGRTTLLRMAAGFNVPDEGRIFLDGVDITRLPPDQRPVNTVFQSYPLFPHLSVRENIALDLKLRERLLIELDAIHDEVGITFIYVTYDQGEAMSISDCIAVMNKGVIEQIGKPAEIYEAPRSSFVAAFIGDTNFLDGKMTSLIDARISKCAIEGIGEITIANDKPASPGDFAHLSLLPEKSVISDILTSNGKSALTREIQ